MPEHLEVIVAIVLAVAVACQWLAWRVKVPAIVFLLIVGIIAGPLAGWLDPDALLGRFMFPFISLSVAVILFEGSLTLKFHEVLGLEKVIQRMVTLGLAVTWVITALAARLFVGFSWEVSFLFGAVTVVTGPTVIVPMLRTVRPTAAVANILRWEGILIDPIGAMLAVLVFEFIVAGGGGAGLGTGFLIFGKIILVGALIGAGAGHVFGVILRRHWLPLYLHNVTALAFVLAAYAASNRLEPESGLLTVTVMGVWLANMKRVDLEEILDFKESLSILLISVLFIILAARIDLTAFATLGWSALFVFAAIQFLARPLNAQVAALDSKLTWPERHILAWIAPRGIVAAAISALFALRLEALGFPEARLMVPLTFLVIIATVLLQSLTARPIAKWLGVAEPEPRGLLIIGANAVATAIAKELMENNFPVLVADNHWQGIVNARMDGLPTYYGNPNSEHAERNLNLVGIGGMLALTPSEDLNALSVEHYRLEFGPNHVFALRTKPIKHDQDKAKTGSKWCRPLFGPEITYAMLASLIAQGAQIKATPLTEKFTFEHYLSSDAYKHIPLFAIDPKDRMHVFTDENPIEPTAGWKIIGLAEGGA